MAWNSMSQLHRFVLFNATRQAFEVVATGQACTPTNRADSSACTPTSDRQSSIEFGSEKRLAGSTLRRHEINGSRRCGL